MRYWRSARLRKHGSVLVDDERAPVRRALESSARWRIRTRDVPQRVMLVRVPGAPRWVGIAVVVLPTVHTAPRHRVRPQLRRRGAVLHTGPHVPVRRGVELIVPQRAIPACKAVFVVTDRAGPTAARRVFVDDVTAIDALVEQPRVELVAAEVAHQAAHGTATGHVPDSQDIVDVSRVR